MTNKTAIILGLFLIGAIIFDLVVDDGKTLVFLAQKGLELIDWLAVWR